MEQTARLLARTGNDARDLTWTEVPCSCGRITCSAGFCSCPDEAVVAVDCELPIVVDCFIYSLQSIQTIVTFNVTLPSWPGALLCGKRDRAAWMDIVERS